jgi:GDP/UDP-N,N'-diacetylbacillosamine 2-epimerase (hydrolysing)
MRNKSVVVVSSNRADYYLLENIIKNLQIDKNVVTKFVVTGAHLSRRGGFTINEIRNRNVDIYDEIAVLDFDEDSSHINLETSITINAFNHFFLREKPDLILLLGDRYEIFGVSIAARNLDIPIAHIYGGEYSYGSRDNYYRDMITLQSSLHLCLDQRASNRVTQLLGGDSFVYQIGHLGLENIRNMNFVEKSLLLQTINVKASINDYICVISMHPATQEKVTPQEQIDFIDNIVRNNENVLFVATSANNDIGGSLINNAYYELQTKYANFEFVHSLGSKLYLNLCSISNLVIGNSSSLMFEVPSLGVPTINLGTRQLGRSRLDSVIDIPYNVDTFNSLIFSNIKKHSFLYNQIEPVESPSNLVIKYINQFLQREISISMD